MGARQSADTVVMYGIDFEDTVFLLTLRIRVVRDTMRLNPPAALFMEKCLDDVMFVDHVLATLADRVEEGDGGEEASGSVAGVLDYAADTEWQFSQLLTEFLLESNAFSAQTTQESRGKIVLLRESSDSRRKVFERFGTLIGEEPVVSPTELSILFGGT